MTTSTNNNVPSREGVEEQSWERDTLGDTHVEDDTVHYHIFDTKFRDGWVQSDVSKNLKEMR
jgi:hypothetical protein